MMPINCNGAAAAALIALLVALATSGAVVESFSTTIGAPSRAAAGNGAASRSLLPSPRRESLLVRLSAEEGASPTTASASTSEATDENSPVANTDDEEDDEEFEMVYEEFEDLTEKDFYNSEWKVGSVMDSDKNKIVETWVRLVCDEDGTNVAIWGDNSKGKWIVDVPSQYFSISKETFGGWFGKRIWAGSMEDYYFQEGTVRGWSPIGPAAVIGQWQARRLGVDKEEAGTAPWFSEDEDDDEEESEKSEEPTESEDSE